ncbi:HAMP domain-containing protein [Waltera sp.]|uniref:HAMP domain-containing protein n=1 Tax=Waltera sp. TaxID=2815806 RepID=UPI0039A2622B
MIAFTLILALFLFLSYYIPLSITSPIRRLTQVTDQVAKGDLTVRSDVTGGRGGPGAQRFTEYHDRQDQRTVRAGEDGADPVAQGGI